MFDFVSSSNAIENDGLSDFADAAGFAHGVSVDSMP